MHSASIFPTTYGPRLAFAPRPLVIPTDPAQALAFAQDADRRADLLLAEGRCDLAERLAHAALEARARASGGRA